MRRVLFTVLLILCGAYPSASSSSYLFLWAGDADHKASDFLAVIDADPASAHYGAIVASIPTGTAGSPLWRDDDRGRTTRRVPDPRTRPRDGNLP